MKRALALLAFLAVPGFASDVTIHFDLSDSVRAALAHGQIQSILVQAAGKAINTTDDTIVVHDVAPGKVKIRAFLKAGELYVVDPKGVDVDVAPDAPAVVTVPVRSLFISGTVTQHGQPFLGHQMNIFPSTPNRDNFGFAVPFKDGRFAFPLPHAGEWDLTMWVDRDQSAGKIRNFVFHENDTRRDVNIDIP